MANGALVREAADGASVTKQAVHVWRRDSADFDEAFRRAWEQGADQLEEWLMECAQKARENPSFQPSLHRALQARRREYREAFSHQIDARVSQEHRIDDRQLEARITGLLEQMQVQALEVAAPAVKQLPKE